MGLAGFLCMDIESVKLFLLLIAPFLFVFTLEALVLYFFRFRKFWAGTGIAVVVNLFSFALIYYVASAILSALGYAVGNFNGLNLQLQVVAFLWWFSVVVEGLLLLLFLRGFSGQRIFLASLLMNFLSFSFFYLFDLISH